MGKVTEKNTKAEILEVVKVQEQKIAELQSGRVNILEESKAKVKEATIAKAEVIANTSLEVKINEIGILITNELTSLTKQIEDKKTEYKAICDGVELMQKEIEDVAQIKASVYTLAAIINAENELKAQFVKDGETRKSELNAELDQIKKEITERKKQHDVEEKEHVAARDKKRKQEEEDFKYNNERNRKLENDRWDDEKAKREKEVKDMEFQSAARECAVSERETNMDKLESQVDSIPIVIAEAVKEAVDKADKAKDKEAAIKESYSKRSHENEIEKLEHKIKFLEDANTAKDLEVKELKGKLDSAYTEIKNIATETVKSAHTSNLASEIKSFMANADKNNQK